MRAIHHLNGNRHDNELSNLALIDIGERYEGKKVTRPRDSQRSKFWNAWNSIDKGQIINVDEGQHFIDCVTESRWWKNRSEIRQINLVRLGNEYGIPQRTSWGYDLRFPKSAQMTEMRLLLGMCHCLHPEDTAWHGTEFGQVLLEAVGRFCGSTMKDQLRKALREQRFKLSRWSDEAKAKRSAQIREEKAKVTLAEWASKLG